jgi:hypothetical protein
MVVGPGGLLLEKGVEVTTMVQHRDDPDLVLVPGTQNTSVKLRK